MSCLGCEVSRTGPVWKKSATTTVAGDRTGPVRMTKFTVGAGDKATPVGMLKSTSYTCWR